MSFRGSTIVTSDRPSAPGEALRLNASIVMALVSRDFRQRFGADALGASLAYLAPLAWIGATWLAFYIFARAIPVHTDTLTFILSGILPYAAFRYVMTGIGKMAVKLRLILALPAVRLEHGIVAAILVEAVNIVAFFAVVYLTNWLFFGNAEMGHVGQFVGGMVLATLLGAAYAYLFAMLSQGNAGLWQAGQVILRPTFFISGVMYAGNELPDRLLDWLGWNPLLHAIDIARSGLLENYESRMASADYVILWIAGMTAAGAAVGALRRR